MTNRDSDLAQRLRTQASSTLIEREDGAPFQPYRDTYASDIFLYHDASDIFLYHDASDASVELKALLCGFNDLRSVARTFHDAELKESAAVMHFLLNDIRAEPIARALLILQAICSPVRSVGDIERLISQLWFSARLDQAALGFWVDQMRACLDIDWLDTDAAFRVRDEATLHGVQTCWRAWLDRAQSAKPDPDVVQSRDSKTASATVRAALASIFNGYDQATRSSLLAQNRCEIDRAVETGTYFTRGSDLVANPTFFAVASDGVARKSIPIEAIVPQLGFFLSGKQTAKEMLVEIGEWCTALCDGLAGDSRHQIEFVQENAVVLLDYLAADPDERFNVIDTSTVMDTCGLLNLLVLGSPLLKRNLANPDERSLFHAYSSNAVRHCPQQTEYLQFMAIVPTGFPPALGVTLVGNPADDHWLAQVQPFQHNHRHGQGVPHFVDFTFAHVDAPAVPVALQESSTLLANLIAILLMAERCPLTGVSRKHTKAGCFSTGAFLPKLLPYAFASRRLVWTGSTPYTSLPFPDVSPLWKAITQCMDVGLNQFDMLAQAALHALDSPLQGFKQCTQALRARFALAVTPVQDIEMNGTPLDLKPFVISRERLALDDAAVTTTVVSLSDTWGPLRGIMADAARAPAATLPLPVEHLSCDDSTMRLVLTLPASKKKTKVALVPAADLPKYRGQLALRVDGKVVTLSMPGPCRAVRLESKRKSVTVVMDLVAGTVAPSLGIGPLIPRIATRQSINDILHGQKPLPPPELHHILAMAGVGLMRTPREMDSFGIISTPFPSKRPKCVSLGEWHANWLKDLYATIMQAASNRIPNFKFVSQGKTLAYVKWLMYHALPPHGKVYGVTLVIDTAAVLVPRGTTSAARAEAATRSELIDRFLTASTSNGIGLLEIDVPAQFVPTLLDVDAIGQINVAFLREEASDEFRHSFRVDISSVHKHADVVKWWFTHLPSLVYYNHVALDMASGLNKDLVAWWLNESGLPLKYKSAALDHATSRNRVDILELWFESGQPLKWTLRSFQVEHPAARKCWERFGLEWGRVKRKDANY
ncbi:hypothetical protein H9P43_007946 [Blastocladiella emersonii ATCC 22665]|nr:hypothetical protein H9P43_007946 [Blastocladiella emersonii ATCC 22665]